MRKVLSFFIMAALVAGLAFPSFAAKKTAKNEKYDRIVAEVVSVDVATRMMVVKEEKTGATRTIKISARAAEQVLVGNRVRVKLKAGTDESAGVRVLKNLEPAVDAASAAASGMPAGSAASATAATAATQAVPAPAVPAKK